MDRKVVDSLLKNIRDAADALYGGSTDMVPSEVEELADDIRGYVFDLKQELDRK